MNKYEILRNQKIQVKHPKTGLPVNLYKIIASRTFGSVVEGTIGGYIQSETNLNQLDDSWVANNAKVFSDAIVCGLSEVKDDAICFSGKIEDSTIERFAAIGTTGTVKGSLVTGKSYVSGNANVADSKIFNSCEVSKNAQLNRVVMLDGCRITDDSIVTNSTLRDVCQILGKSKIDTCQVSGRYVSRSREFFQQTLHTEISLNIIQGFDEE